MPFVETLRVDVPHLRQPGLLLEALEAARDAGQRVVVLEWNGGSAPARLADHALVERFELPLLFAALEGTLTGAALDLALACDIRLAAAGASLVPGSRRNPRLRVLAGGGVAATMLARGQPLEAEAAFAAGLVTFTGTAAAVRAEAQRLAEVIASRGPFATRLAKEALWHGLAMPLEQALRFETDLTLLLQATKDRAEGVRAFLEKRAPVFTGE